MINVDKTKVVKFGKNRDSNDILCHDLNLIWTNNFTSLDINYAVTDLDNIPSLNIEPMLLEIDNLIRIWQNGNLTLIGKVILIKSIFISKLIHILLYLPTPRRKLFTKIKEDLNISYGMENHQQFRKQIIKKTTAEGDLPYLYI